MTNYGRIITIDGPSGAGKGTVAAAVASTLGWRLLDSGALYRATALLAVDRQVAMDDETRLAALALELPVVFNMTAAGLRVALDGADVTDQMRTEICGDNASKVAALTAVREALVERQRAFARPPGVVADGRDMGTAIFPAAPLKIFLTASAEARAQRRHKQLKEKNFDVTVVDLLAEIEGRDARDANRSASPLVPAHDAIVIDSTHLSADDVVAQVLEMKCLIIGIGSS